jgi:hypothetical protein
MQGIRSLNVLKKIRFIHPALIVQVSILVSIACLLPIAPRLTGKVSCNPPLEIFRAPGATQVFAITVPLGSTLANFSVLTLGAPNLDFKSVTHGTTCPRVVAGTCTIQVQFSPTAVGRRQGAVVLYDLSGNVLQTISLDGAWNGTQTSFGTRAVSATTGDGNQDGSATDSLVAEPREDAVDGFGNRYIPDEKANMVRKVSPTGVISMFAGTGKSGYSGDGGPATGARLNGPMAAVVDGAGFVYIADTGNNVVRMVNGAGIISTYAGQYYATGMAVPPVCSRAKNSVGDGCLGDQIVLNTPVYLVFCNAQNLHISDKLNHRIRTVIRENYRTITQVGNGKAGYNGDGELSTNAELNRPTGITMDSANYIYIADTGNHIIRKTLLTGYTPNPISTIAGTPGRAGSRGDNGPANSAELNSPHGVQVDAAGDVYISDAENGAIRKVSSIDAVISTIASQAMSDSGREVVPTPGPLGGVQATMATQQINRTYH